LFSEMCSKLEGLERQSVLQGHAPCMKLMID
jgi:hypothetical protein